MIDKIRNLVLKIIKFCITGFTGLILDFAITFTCRELLNFNSYVSSCLGISVAMITIFYIHRHWTFSRGKEMVGPQLATFLVISSLGLLLNTIIVYTFQHFFNSEFYWSKLFAVLVVGVWNFTMNLRFTFKSAKNREDILIFSKD